MFASAGKAAAMLFDRDFIGTVLWSLLLTAILFVLLFAGVEYGLAHLPPLGSVWVNRFLELATPILLVLAIFFLGAPVAAIFGSLYLDRIAAKVDAHFYPNDPRAAGTPLVTGIREAFRLIGLSLLINVVLLPIDIGVPGVSEIATILANGWLLGREFFELASTAASFPSAERCAAPEIQRKDFRRGAFDLRSDSHSLCRSDCAFFWLRFDGTPLQALVP